MLVELDIRNYALIDRVKINFSSGLNIMTGETGAGKSIIIGAMGLILGERASSEIVRTGADNAVVRAEVDISNNQQVNNILSETNLQNEDDNNFLIISREVSQNGRSRCWINDKSATTNVLREIGDYLIDIHGQHEHQTLFRKEKHLEFLDDFGGLRTLTRKVEQLYDLMQKQQMEYQKLLRERDEKLRQKELLEFQLKELESAKLAEDEEEKLLRERQILNNAEQIFELSNDIYERLYGSEKPNFIPVLDILKSIKIDFGKLQQIDPQMAEIQSRFDNAIYDLEDISRYILDYRDNVEFNPHRLSEIESRLDLIYRLKRKYLRDSVSGLIDYKNKIKQDLEDIFLSSTKIDSIKKDIQEIRNKACEVALELSKQRKYYAKKLKKLIEKELSDLGMPRTVFEVQITQNELTNTEGIYIEDNGKKYQFNADGIDQAEFLISPNVGEELKPLTKIASGGEISRIMLALKAVLAEGTSLSPDTMIFDEIDTGIGGRIAEVVGKKLKELSKSRQVICITHLPQIASLADSHCRVQKRTIGERTVVEVQKLNDDEVVNEIARMLAGEKITDVTIAHAREMIEQAKQI